MAGICFMSPLSYRRLINLRGISIRGHKADEFVAVHVTSPWVINPVTRVVSPGDRGFARLMRPSIIGIFNVPVEIDT